MRAPRCAHAPQRKIDHEARLLQANAAKFGKQTAQWTKLVDQFNTALKEIGDVRSWAATIERDLVHVCDALERLQREQPNAVDAADDAASNTTAERAAAVAADADADADDSAPADAAATSDATQPQTDSADNAARASGAADAH